VLEIEALQRRGEEERHQNVGVAEALERMDCELGKCRKDLDAAVMRARKVLSPPELWIFGEDCSTASRVYAYTNTHVDVRAQMH